MLTLQGQRIVLRGQTPPLQSPMVSRWHVWIRERFDVEAYRAGYQFFNLFTGITEARDLDGPSFAMKASGIAQQTYSVPPGYVVFRRPAALTIGEAYVWSWDNDYETDEDATDDLEVMRDAVLAGEDRLARDLGRRMWPHSYQLYIALCKKERELLDPATKGLAR